MASAAQMKDPLLVGKAIRAQLENEIPRDLPLEKDFSELGEYTITDHVLELHEKLSVNPRTTFIIDNLVKHLHAFARETMLTHSEWETAIKFLTRAGKESSQHVNEFILLSDCLGLSVLLDELNHPKPAGCTLGCEEGPFLTVDAPEVPSGSTISHPDTTGEKMHFSATIKNTKGEGIAGAKVEVWQANGDGVYDVQYAVREHPDDRARIVAEPDGSFSYRAVLPTAYPIPSDGPTGDFLAALGRHAHRASHIHFLITAPGYDTLTSALYPSHSPFLGTDPVFATKKSLICELKQDKDPKSWKEKGFKEGEVVNGRVWVWSYNFVLPTLQEVAEVKKIFNERKEKQI
ncbi:aromatic compound dioxygenase [Exidia glandulosa HHB12029]|uniref:Aromatic compound dioxygenase n=1 Tax=Exidia glandulosa HHB12029 TaxID=1314781 RepID=A0A165NC82_EXIGL|nr:aromatic compound dioxygenase [Exidia glandulosa HHB12029]